MRILYLSFFVVLIDQVTKFFIKGIKIASLGINIDGMPYGSSKEFIGSFVKFTFIENPGMAFGITMLPKVFLIIITFIASIVIIYFIYKNRNSSFLVRISLALILAGALGNLIDRIFYGLIYKYAPIFYGRVVDFIQIECWDFTIFGRTYTTWPVLNLADISVSVGFLIILLFRNRIFSKHTEPVPEIPETVEQQF